MENPQGSNQGLNRSMLSRRSQMFSSAVSKTLSLLGRKPSTSHLSQFVQTTPPPAYPPSPPLFASESSAPEILQQNFKIPSRAPCLPELHFSSDPLMEHVPTPPGSMGRANLIDIKRKSNVPHIPSEWIYGPDTSTKDISRRESSTPRNQPLRPRDSYQSMSSIVSAFVAVGEEVVQNGQTRNDANIQYYPHGDIPKVKIYGVDGQLETEARVSLHRDCSPRVTFLDFPDDVWKNLAAVTEPWDLSRLSRCSKGLQNVIDPHLYAKINLRTNQPHGFSYAYLSELLDSLTEPGNRIKLRRYVKYFKVAAGWQENSIKLYDGVEPLTTDDIRDTDGEQMFDPETVIELIKEEGLEGDGGIKEVNYLLATFLNHALGLETFILDTAIPLRSGLIATIATVSTIRRVEINIAQPTRTQRNVDNWRVLEKSLVGKYRPSISLFSKLSLSSLRLTNLPTRGGPWYIGLWKLVEGLIALRVLQVELPVISRARYPNMFDEEGWVIPMSESFSPKMPPVWEGNPPAVHTLALSGFIVDASSIKNVRNLSLIGCMRMKSKFPHEWTSLEYFRATGWAFIDLAMKSTDRTTRELHFTTLADEGSPSPTVDLTKKIFLSCYPTLCNLKKLTLKRQWHLAPRQMTYLLRYGNNLTQLGLWVPEEAWALFLRYVPAMHRIEKIHILNEGVDRIGEMAGRLISFNRVFQGTIIAIGKCAWRITLESDVFDDWQWRFERVGGGLEEVLGKGLGGGY
ncbi:hypothetical protein L873DRAFT_1788063 [Choiromyces venosus 120613-1]|uniref:F-box domain-containing protein n=1 Tax=Choiromyces venosus 120613-1 TaxID=1336337 RepID=A0A3N4JTM6_9PEZI|nr:hypothetical protein L873DRAFT_1788063 [Choiromyces venosus 120613-1]